MQILAATDFSTRSNRALRQAGLLAQPGNAQLHIVHVVDDDQPDELVRMEEREAERLLNEQTASMPELRNVQTRLMVVTGDPFDGILRAAAEVNADLIVMGSHRKQLLDIIVGTTIERVIRKGPFPVLMVNNEAQRKYENVLAPVDMVDASADALRVATTTGLIGDNRATLLHAFMPVGKGKMFIGGADQDSIDSYVASERDEVMNELAAFLAASVDRIGGRWSLRVEEGGPMEVISRVISEIRPDLLVMGTNGRSGLLKVLIGSVTEEASTLTERRYSGSVSCEAMNSACLFFSAEASFASGLVAEPCRSNQNHQRYGRCCDDENDHQQLMQYRSGSKSRKINHRRRCDKDCSERRSKRGRVDALIETRESAVVRTIQ